jgi:hypothetical protein
METWFAHLEALVTNLASDMVAQVKPTTPVPSESSTQGFNPRFFYGVGFSRPLGLDEIKSGNSNDHVSRATIDKTWLRFQQLHQLPK